jgi:hypothetical protein
VSFLAFLAVAEVVFDEPNVVGKLLTRSFFRHLIRLDPTSRYRAAIRSSFFFRFYQF